ncbi:cyclin-dependent protein kinase inhibitor SMR4 [Eucalyptus grandis]|uniref:Uncharacterized protein n=2 Tax=Eucalyptus grandis TaxID=71139 RepID=A0ACC3LSP4_EUCGR|nr:cyclin-dependent protein kinase inhibitor SMR4 [Eucalyptus grandis]KAK3442087.1 hypothetical protein EUGRSUZ_B02319 [Eucalyptus grandis]
MGSEDVMLCEEGVMMMMERDGCATPTRGEFRIPAASAPPPPPRKKQSCSGKKRGPPKDGYFQAPDDLELLFAAGKRQACP